MNERVCLVVAVGGGGGGGEGVKGGGGGGGGFLVREDQLDDDLDVPFGDARALRQRRAPAL
jgi:hypothetical protein